MLKNPISLFLFVILSSLSMPSWADWQLDNTESSLHYVTSKASAVSEVNSFSGLSGQISEQGRATLQIGLGSVDTAIEIRNQRVRDMLFEVGQYPSASIVIDVNMTELAALPVGSSLTAPYNYNLSLHGISRDLSANLRLTKITANRIEIQPAQPLIISADTFGMTEGVEALREIAGLPSINHNVVVDFSLVYDDRM
tara:strand:- start:65912 stop:66502 length:591 start_codon:yes stop_codon:yes gene_type:complete